MTDPRVAPVEGNLLDFFGACSEVSLLTREPWDDVTACFSAVPFPLFNAIVGARFAPGTEAGRASAVVERYVGRALPFLWWTTPSTSSPALEEALAAAGMQREDVPGMHVDLGDPQRPVAPPAPAGVELVPVDLTTTPEPFVATMLEGFGMPAELTDSFHQALGELPGERMVNVVAVVDGEPAATATGWFSGAVVGIYNVATVERFRGRGVGAAVTAAVMDAGRERGAAEAVLHATEAGRPVYERLGFVEVCTVPQFVWAPA